MPEEAKEVTPDGRVVEQDEQSKDETSKDDLSTKETKVESKDDNKQDDDSPKEININDFLAAKDEPLIAEPKDDTKKESDDKHEEKKSEDDEEVDQEVVAAPKQVKKKDERDVEDLDEEYRPLFKKDMSNEAFAKLKPIIKEHKQLKEALTAKDIEIENLKKGALPDSYYENPKSVFLTPEFESLSTAVEKSQIVANHWKKQLIAVKKGDDKFQFLDTDDKGNFVTKEVAVNDETETELQELLTFANNQTQKFQGKMESLIEGHSTKVKEAMGTIKEFNSKVFPIFDDPEKGKALKPLVEDTMKRFPSVFRKNPLLESLARSIVVNQKLADLLQQSAKPDPKKEVKNDRKKSGPLAGEATGGGTTNGKESEVTIDMFEQVKNS